MIKKFKNLQKEDFTRVIELYKKQPWLLEKEEHLLELINLCDTNDHKDLIVNLLNAFKYLSSKDLNNYYNYITDKIINKTGFDENRTQIASITIDDDADSSQRVLNDIKVPLFKKGWINVKTVNRFNDIPKNYKKGKNQIILIDEFIGSGKTIKGRIKNINEWLKGDFDLKFCFVAGMDYGINIIENYGYEVYCPLRLPKGISERYVGAYKNNAIQRMKALEEKLAQQIDKHFIETFTLGYNDTQALYSLESCFGNTPNSVFPILWWPRYFNDSPRNTLLTRVEQGLK